MKQDRRVQKTESLYQQALLQLLKTKQLKDISITELSEVAHINRGTFYLHYKGIDELFYHIEKRMLACLEEICKIDEEHTFYVAPYTVLLDIFQYLDSNRSILDVILGRDAYFMSEMRRILTMYCVQRLSAMYKGASKEMYDLVGGYTVEGMICVFKEWVYNQHQYTAEEMAIHLQRMILHGAESLK